MPSTALDPSPAAVFPTPAMVTLLAAPEGPRFEQGLLELARAAQACGQEDWHALARKLVKTPADPKLLHKLGYLLLDGDCPQCAVHLLRKAYQLKPHIPEHILEYVCALEELQDYPNARQVLLAVDPARLKDTFELCYLLAFNHLMCQDLAACDALLPGLLKERDVELAPLALELSHMSQRAHALDGQLNHRQAWHFALTSGILLDPALQPREDSAALAAWGCHGVVMTLRSWGLWVPAVWAPPHAPSQALGKALSQMLAVPLRTLPEHGSLDPGVVAVHRLEALSPATQAALSWHHAGQLLWVHASPVTPEPEFCADVITFLCAGFSPREWAREAAQEILGVPVPAVSPRLQRLVTAAGTLRSPAGNGAFQSKGMRRRQRGDHVDNAPT